MSLVSTYVQSREGTWFKNPRIESKDRWFVCWDDEDLPELVALGDDVSSAIETFSRAIIELHQAGIRMESPDERPDCFGMRTFDGKTFKPAVRAWLTSIHSIPEALLVSDDPPQAKPGYGVLYVDPQHFEAFQAEQRNS